jgi:diphthamide biosynthesis protein 3
MGAYYDEIEIEDMVWDEEKRVYHYPCPCGDRFEISRKQLKNYEDIATCPSCSLIIRVIYDPVSLFKTFISTSHNMNTALQLDYEDDPDSDAEDASGTDSDSDGSDADFEDALEKLHISS